MYSFKRTEEQELLLESLGEMMQEFPDEYWKKCDEERKFPQEWYEKMVECGFHLLGLPEEIGGTPVDAVTHLMFIEEMGRLGGPVTLMGNFLRVKDVMSFGTEEQVKDVLKQAETAPVSFSIGSTEPQAGSDSKGITTRAVKRNGKVYITGHKSFISHALNTSKMMTACIDDDGNVTLYMVPFNSPGVTMEDVHKIGFKCSSTCEVYLDNVEVDESDRFGPEGKGFLCLMENYAYERLVIAAQALGYAECAYEDAMKYVNQREQFGKRIADFQLTQQKALEMYLRIENMKNLLYKGAWNIDNDIEDRVLPNAAKYYCTREGFKVIDDAMSMMGGIGCTDDCRISRLWRDSRMFRITGGTDEIMIHTAGRGLLKRFR